MANRQYMRDEKSSNTRNTQSLEKYVDHQRMFVIVNKCQNKQNKTQMWSTTEVAEVPRLKYHKNIQYVTYLISRLHKIIRCKHAMVV